MSLADNCDSIVLGAGCFWCVEGVFSTIHGVTKTEIGYGGGNHENPTYKSVSHNPDGHSELTIITFDKTIISLVEILDIFYKIHDPNKHYIINDKKGELYRSVVLYQNEDQKQSILTYITQLEKRTGQKINTEVRPFKNFKLADDKYQNYFLSNPDKPFCRNIIRPKIQRLKVELDSEHSVV